MNYDTIAENYVSMVKSTALMEMPTISTINREIFDSGNKRLLDLYRRDSKSIGKNHRSVQVLPDTVALFHTQGLGYHSVSFFKKLNRSTVMHTAASKMDHPDSSGIYKNIQYMLDHGKTVYSDVIQSPGGRKLWTNMHKHVNYGGAHIEKNGERRSVDNFESFANEHDFSSQFVLTPHPKS